jgi:hypothetical protein
MLMLVLLDMEASNSSKMLVISTRIHSSIIQKRTVAVLVQKPPNKRLIQLLYDIYVFFKYINNSTNQKLMCPIQFQSLLIVFSLSNSIPLISNNKAPKPFKSF